ncbi:hypothetical protein [Methanosarcina sp.]|uniref:hypothetical protein n=1 Tax=Methanosarcina sp. TaxID=2213 RepID=UPI002988AAE2|nr:hypothetical protein [Methanosarcina sp.]MDW5548972.1 hypothetical protein [Methanosarcina sp.]MDW5552675.1 hypothetical protein [Methanosarcina sp.]MDW5559231.1 hypothetical protein [Methanosarcina sp.]
MCFYVLNHAWGKQWNQPGQHIGHETFYDFWHHVGKLFLQVIRHGDSYFHSFKHIRHNFGMTEGINIGIITGIMGFIITSI